MAIKTSYDYYNNTCSLSADVLNNILPFTWMIYEIQVIFILLIFLSESRFKTIYLKKNVVITISKKEIIRALTFSSVYLIDAVFKAAYSGDGLVKYGVDNCLISLTLILINNDYIKVKQLLNAPQAIRSKSTDNAGESNIV